MPISSYIFYCGCGFKWEKFASNPAAEECRRCKSRGLAPKPIKYRKKRSDAKKPGASFGAEESVAANRPSRDKRKAPEPAFTSSYGEEIDAEEMDDEVDNEINDPLFVNSPQFNPALRYSGWGSSLLTRAWAMPTVQKSQAWTGITQSLGVPRTTSAAFGGVTADDHGKMHAVGYSGAPTITKKQFEWCHLIADCLGGDTVNSNLFCGTFHANTAMLCLEVVLRGKTWLEVKVEVELKPGTDLGEKITYRVRGKRKATSNGSKKTNAVEFERVIDALATGCTKAEGEALSDELRVWLRKHGLLKR